MKVSVALAAYKGEKYIAEQLISILSQLGENDEIIVSDDFPQGKTREAVLGINDSRIKYIDGPGKGIVANFENAMNKTTGDIIFLCDQDDVWLDDKVKTVTEAIRQGSDLVLHNASITNADLSDTGETCFGLYHSNKSFIKNFISNSFVGCCMAFKREVMTSVLPIPKGVPMHDWYIALAAIKKGFNITLIDKPLMLWRRHDSNVTGGATSLGKKLIFRIKMIGSLIPVCHGKD